MSDRIGILLWHGETSRMPEVFEAHGDFIQGETLADELRLVDESYPEMTEARVGDEAVRVRVEKAAEDGE